MLKTLQLLGLLLINYCLFAQNTTNKNTEWATIYRGTKPKINDLLHTKLDVRFDFDKAYMYGKAWITLRPHFYKTDSLALDAKGMNINKVSIIENGLYKPLKYTYDSTVLRINLPRTYYTSQTYTVYIDYTAKPNELRTVGSKAISNAKGLYFINPQGKDSSKPTQIWTQGETEGSSVWFPTIDDPNQKTTEEIAMTVPAKYKTLSNGLLITQKKNTNGTRTDTWKMDLPHSPYLFFMGVGNFAVVKDSYKGKEVSYYVEPEYGAVARRIFGLTPEMMAFFSKKLNYEYPWAKYAQITGRDYVSGAMENTTATLHSDYLQQSARQLTDGNKYEDYISHELFHQWFGDLVTAESWSNLTVNESLADYSEYLWREYKHGKNDADAHHYGSLQAYLNNGNAAANLVRFFYRDKEDMFDLVTYQKGGRVLHMLRNYVGDSAFFASLNLYLKTNQFKNAEAHQLRLAFEQVTGQDLNWFWNQWYYGSGHPQLAITYGYDSSNNEALVYVKQKQAGKAFKLPFNVDVFIGTASNRYKVLLENKNDTFRFKSNTLPNFIDFDAEKILLAVVEDEKTNNQYVFQYKHAASFQNRLASIAFASSNNDQPASVQLLTDALNDPYYKLRARALEGLKMIVKSLPNATINTIETIAKKDAKRTTRAAAIDVLGKTGNKNYEAFFVSNASDSSYTVAGAALTALANINEVVAITLAPGLQKDAKGDLAEALSLLEILQKGDRDFDEMTADYDSLNNYERFSGYRNYLTFLTKVTNTQNFKKGLDKIVKFRNLIAGYSKQYADLINGQLQELIEKKTAGKTAANSTDIDEQVAYIKEKLNK